jgi:hypothetical protein
MWHEPSPRRPRPSTIRLELFLRVESLPTTRRVPQRAQPLSRSRAGGGDATLLDLVDGSRQLFLYRFFMDPDMDVNPERSCPGCSMYADQLSNLLHLRERDTRFVAVSRGEASPAVPARRSLGTSCRSRRQMRLAIGSVASKKQRGERQQNYSARCAASSQAEDRGAA